MTLGTALLELEVPEHRPGFFDELRDELGRRTAGFARRRMLVVAAAAAVVAGTLAFALTRGSDVAAAAQVRAAVERALASTGSISGVLITHGVPHRFIFSSTGAFRVLGTVEGHRSQVVYDPARNILTLSEGSAFDRVTGFAAGPPDANPFFLVQQLGLGSVVATLADAHDSTVENVTYDGRPAWRLRASTGNPGEQEVFTIDRATGMPVHEELLRDGHLVSEVRIDQLRVSATVPRITVPVPARGQNVQVHDAGFRRVSLAAARHAAGYSPLVPKRLPHGFTLTGIAFAPRYTVSEDSSVGGNPPSHDVISLSYHRGFDEILVTMRRTGPDSSAWKDPFPPVSSPTAPTPSGVTFTGGALAGDSGYLVISPGSFPHIWTVGPKLVVTIAGTVDRADLLTVANSLHVAG